MQTVEYVRVLLSRQTCQIVQDHVSLSSLSPRRRKCSSVSELGVSRGSWENFSVSRAEIGGDADLKLAFPSIPVTHCASELRLMR